MIKLSVVMLLITLIITAGAGIISMAVTHTYGCGKANFWNIIVGLCFLSLFPEMVLFILSVAYGW